MFFSRSCINDFERQILMKMKLTLILLFVGFINLLAVESYSQSTKLNVKLGNTSVEKVLEIIENQSEFRFVYNRDVIDLERKVKVNSKNASIEEVLDGLFEETDVKYQLIDRTVVLTTVTNAVGSLQQQKSVSGKVSDENGEPLPGVTVLVKGTTNGTVTNFDGEFSLSAIEAKTILQFSFVGMTTQEVEVGNQAELSITLVADAYSLEEVVAIGYGTQKKSSITGAIAAVKAEKLDAVPVPNLSNALAGRLSGVFVNQASGAPGYAASIRIRAVNTWTGSGANPLFVIDGIISDKTAFDGLDNSEVENITVLKDAASSAIYGARAANGVILVTTKTGKSGKFQLNYSYSYSFDKPSKIPEYMDAADMVRTNNYAFEVSGQPHFYDAEEVAYFNENDPGRDWYNLAYNDPTLQKHTLNASGGSEKIRYFLGASYFDQTGFIKTSGFEKYNIRANLDMNFTEELSGIFKISVNEGTTNRFTFQEDNVDAFTPSATFGTLWGRLLYYLPTTPPLTSDGKFINPGWIGSPLAFIEEGGYNETSNQNVDFLMGLTYKIPFIEGLSVAGRLSKSMFTNSRKHYEVKPTVYNVVREGSHGHIYTDEIISSQKTSYPSKERLGKYISTSDNYQLNLSANYQKTIDKHNIDALFVYEQSEGKSDVFYGVRENFPLLQRDQFWATSGDRADSYVGGSEYEFGRASYIGRLAYEYDGKYFFTGTVRRDGSMRFAPDYRWGNFPSASAGWVISEEDFLESDFLNFLKLRASWGLVGNDAVGGWQWQESFGVNGTALIGTAVENRLRYDGIVNSELTWEKTREWNIGIDSRFLDGVILNAEYYNKHTYDILASRRQSLAASFGGNMPPVNYGIVDAHGFELELGYSGKVRDINYSINGNFSYQTNEVKLRDVAENVRYVNDYNGKSTDYVAMLVSTGIIRTQAELDALPEGYTIYGKAPALGALNFEDVSGVEPGVPDGKINDYDRQVIEGKHYSAPYTYGLNLTADWKGFGVDLMFQGVSGVSKLYNDGYGRRFMVWSRPPTFWLDSWTPETPDAKYPQPVSWGVTNDHVASTFWLKNSSYLRLSHLNLNYTLPESITEKLRMSKVRLRATGTNLFTISSFDYHDPSVAEMRSYPTMKTYTLGVEVTF